jgi:hypothetical protein
MTVALIVGCHRYQLHRAFYPTSALFAEQFLLVSCFGIFFGPENGGELFARSIRSLSVEYRELYFRKLVITFTESVPQI